MVSQPASHSSCVLSQALYACRIDVKHAVQHQNCLTLGTGRTMAFVLEALARRIREEGLRLEGIPTSEATAARARALAIPLAAPDTPCDLAIDGADQV